jgi:hypothetical protein
LLLFLLLCCYACFLQVPLDELLDDLEGLGLDDDAAAAGGQQHYDAGGSDMMED